MTRAAQLAVLMTIAYIAACGAEGPDSAGTTNTTVPAGRTATLPAREELLPVAGTVTIFGADPQDSLGTVASGDFNGDGAKDALVGAAFADGPDNTRPDAGEVYVFLGPFSPGETRDAGHREHDLIIYGADEGDQAGRSIAAGDFNGDGIDDIIIGAPFADGPDNSRDSTGEVYVVFGSPSLGTEVSSLDLAGAIADVSIYGDDPSGFMGLSIATANLNGDRFADLVIGAFWGDGPDGTRPQAGEVYTVYGSVERRTVDTASGEQDATIYGALEGDRLGESVDAGDVNGDGIDDLVLAAPFAATRSGEDAGGRVYVILSPLEGRVDLLEQPVESVIYGVDGGDQLGHATAVGNIDGDGQEDLVLTSVSSDGFENAFPLAGEAVVVWAGSLRQNVDLARGEGGAVIYGARAGDRLGRSAALGDLDGDGLADILLGAPDALGPRGETVAAGALYVVPSAHLAETVVLPERSLVFHGEDTSDSLSSAVFGRRPIAVDDMNGDGRADVLVSAPRAAGPANARPASGEAYILFLELP